MVNKITIYTLKIIYTTHSKTQKVTGSVNVVNSLYVILEMLLLK